MKVYTHLRPDADAILSIAALMLLKNVGVKEVTVNEVTEEEIPETLGDDEYVVDVGLKWDGEKWFDHHQIDSFEMESATSLVLAAAGFPRDEISPYCAWYDLQRITDNNGPRLALKLCCGIENPTQEMVANFFATSLISTLPMLYEKSVVLALEVAVTWMKTGLENVMKMGSRIQELEEMCVKHDDIWVFPETDNPFGMGLFLKKNDPEHVVKATIIKDNRANDWCLCRTSDDSGVDFGLIRGLKGVGFVHATGFLAKVDGTLEEAIDIVKQSRTTQ